MNIRNIGSNQAEVTTAVGVRVLVSYATPVAAYIPGRGFVRARERYSVTTSRHVNAWLDGADAESIPQAEIAALV